MNRYSKILLCLTLFSITSTSLFAIRIIKKNENCPQEELYVDTQDTSYSNVEKKIYSLAVAPELIEAANNIRKFEVNKKQFLMLLKEATEKQNQNEKKEQKDQRTEYNFDKTDNNEKITVTEKTIVALLPFLRYTGMIRETNPPQMDIYIQGKPVEFYDIITSVISDYKHWHRMLCQGWIRCNNRKDGINFLGAPVIFYDAQYLIETNQTSMYKTDYAPTFREVVDGSENCKLGDLIHFYQVMSDPKINNNPMLLNAIAQHCPYHFQIKEIREKIKTLTAEKELSEKINQLTLQEK